MQGFLIYRALLIILIYAFLAVALYIIWREFSHNAQKMEDSLETAVILLSNEETSDVSEHQLRPVTAIGRASDNHIIIEDPFASTHHAVIVWRDRQWWLEDLESHNGTRLNDDVMSEPTVLTSGDVIHIGETELKFELRQV
jgi:pSer/pThr/pTyr-binding forkhead associated (FHA) protein